MIAFPRQTPEREKLSGLVDAVRLYRTGWSDSLGHQ